MKQPTCARSGREVRRDGVCVELRVCRRGNLGTLAAAPCAMQRGSLARAAPVVVSCLGATISRDAPSGSVHQRKVPTGFRSL
jgi:hypothetical protein